VLAEKTQEKAEAGGGEEEKTQRAKHRKIIWGNKRGTAREAKEGRTEEYPIGREKSN